MPQDQKSIQQPEGQWGDDKQIDRGDAASMIAKKGSPAQGWPFPPPDHVLGNTGLADSDAELEPFAMDARRTLELVGHAHVPDQLTDLQRDLWPSTASSGFPTPERSKSSTVRASHGLGPDDGQRIYNARNEAIQPSEHQSVESAENKSLRRSAPQHIDLLPENQDFRLKLNS